mmetsp:Transcript_28122/g.80822  ORF Transcript_28122/g.80822 Transcript_28122/m.80822 type:complete len:154 (-) Transcript_28122:179-640(-)
MGATQCSTTQRCKVEGIASAAALEISSCMDVAGENLDGCTVPGLSDLFEEEKEPSGPLKEYTYAVESGALVLGNAAEDQIGLSHRSNASDIERQEEFQKHRLEVAKRNSRATRLKDAPQPILFPAMAGGKCNKAPRAEQLNSRYKSLGINVVN